MTVMVTGVAGFIGSHLAELLAASGVGVVGIDNFSNFYDKKIKQRNLADLDNNTNFRFHELDVRQTNAIAQLIRSNSISKVVHLAGRGGVPQSVVEPYPYLEETLQSTLSILESCKDTGVKLFVNASSSSVYGDSTSQGKNSESDATDAPTAPYAAFKKASELLAHSYHHIYGITVCNVRLFSVYGPRGRPDQIVYKLTRMIDRGDEIPLYETDAARDFTYVSDICAGLFKTLDLPDKTYLVVNLSYGGSHAVSEVAQLISEKMGRPALFAGSPTPAPASDFRWTLGDNSRAREVLAWQPLIALGEGVSRFVEWYRETHRT